MQNCKVCGGKKWLPIIDRRTGLQKTTDITLIVQDLSDGLLDFRSRNLNDAMSCHLRIADAGQIICYRVSDVHYIKN